MTTPSTITLRQLLAEHPEWADLPLAVYTENGELDYVGCAGSVYQGEDYIDPDMDVSDPRNVKIDVLIFSAN